MIAHTLKIAGYSLAAMSAVSLAVIAQTAPPPVPAVPQPAPKAAATSNPMAACRADMKALCASVERGKGAKMQCLVENKAKASAECQSAMLTIQDRMAARLAEKGEKRGRLAACRTDIVSLCPDATKGKERAKCLRQNEAKVSPVCAQALSALPMRKQEETAAPGAAAQTGPPTAAPVTPKPQ